MIRDEALDLKNKTLSYLCSYSDISSVRKRNELLANTSPYTTIRTAQRNLRICGIIEKLFGKTRVFPGFELRGRIILCDYFLLHTELRLLMIFRLFL